MNIFRVDNCPVVAAQSLIDIHVNKMIVESVQMLCNAYTTTELEKAPLTQSGNVRKHSHLHHPCSKWALSGKGNYVWLMLHTEALIEERKYRFDKGHFCESIFNWVASHIPSLPLGETDPPRAFDKTLYNDGDIVEAYRNYYRSEKAVDKNGKPMLKYTRRSKPHWF